MFLSLTTARELQKRIRDKLAYKVRLKDTIIQSTAIASKGVATVKC